MFISPVVTAVNVLLKSPGIARLSCSMLRDLYVTDAPVTELLNVPTLSMKLMFLTKLPFVSLKLGPYLWTVALSMMSNELEPLPQTMPVSSVYDFVLSNQPLGAANADGTNASASTSVAAPPSPINQCLTLYMSPPFVSVIGVMEDGDDAYECCKPAHHLFSFRLLMRKTAASWESFVRSPPPGLSRSPYVDAELPRVGEMRRRSSKIAPPATSVSPKPAAVPTAASTQSKPPSTRTTTGARDVNAVEAASSRPGERRGQNERQDNHAAGGRGPSTKPTPRTVHRLLACRDRAGRSI